MNLQSLNAKWHGLPVWAWAAIATILLYLAYRWWENRSSGGSSNSAPLAVVTQPRPQTPEAQQM